MTHWEQVGGLRRFRRAQSGDITEMRAFCVERGMPTLVASVRREHVEAFLVDLDERGTAAATRAQAFRSLQQFWKFVERRLPV